MPKADVGLKKPCPLCSGLLDAIRKLRKIDSGAWLKDCQSMLYTCKDGEEERLALQKQLDAVYEAAGIWCEICGHDDDVKRMPAWLMGGKGIAMCHDCFSEWYDGETDTDKIKAAVQKKRSI